MSTNQVKATNHVALGFSKMKKNTRPSIGTESRELDNGSPAGVEIDVYTPEHHSKTGIDVILGRGFVLAPGSSLGTVVV